MNGRIGREEDRTNVRTAADNITVNDKNDIQKYLFFNLAFKSII